MTIDYTKLLAKLNPEPGGEDVLRLRTGVVSAVNSDGTVNVAISGVVIPHVPRLAGTILSAASNVQVLSYRGSLLVLDAVARNANVLPMVDGGVVSAIPIAINDTSRPVTGVSFNRTFTTTPAVTISPLGTSGQIQRWTARLIAVSLTSFDAILEIGAAADVKPASATTMDLHWIAVQR